MGLQWCPSAALRTPVRTSSELRPRSCAARQNCSAPKMRSWRMERLAHTPHVVVADYELLRRDFAELRGLSEDAMDAWLIEQGSFFRRPSQRSWARHANEGWQRQGLSHYSSINRNASQAVSKDSLLMPHTFASSTCTALLPPRYGRAALLPALSPDRLSHIGFLDVKGSGT